MAWPAREYGVTDHRLTVQPEADAAWGMSGDVDDSDLPLSDPHLHSMVERDVGRQVERRGICGVNAYRSARRLPHSIQRPNVVRVTMRQKNVPNKRATGSRQNLLRACSRVHNRQLSRFRAL
jgi:hypothetical protein